MKRGTLGLAAAVLLLTGCMVGPDYRRPAYPLPSTFRSQPAAEGGVSFGDLEWWRIFEDEQLVELIRTALRQNYDLQIAVARVLDARAQLVIARSFLYPTVTAGLSAPYTRFVGRSGQFDPGLVELNQLFQGTGGFDLGYEIDFWGRIRRATEAARAQLLAFEWARQVVVSTLVADVARAYFELRAFDEQLEISRQTLTSREASLRLIQTRLSGGVGTLLDVRQAEILVEQAAQAIPDFQRLIEQKENEISVLLGRNPGPIPRGRPVEQQLALPPLPPGLTSAVLERRPDIRQAEEQLVAANAQIGVAKAELFPLVTLTGSAGVGGNIFNGTAFGPFGFFGISPGVSIPVFNAGRVQAGVDAAKARTTQAILGYQQTVQQAFREVADSLIAFEKFREFRIQKELLVASTRDAVRLSSIRYRGGVASYLEVLDSETRRFTAELDLVVAAASERVAVVQLYRALGGGWDYAPNVRPSTASVEAPPTTLLPATAPGRP